MRPASSSLPKDFLVLLGTASLLYGAISLTHYWAGPVNTQPVIHLDPRYLPKYALFSVSRLTVAYLFSLMFALVYAYVAAHNARAERVMVPVLDTLQSIPVLSFLPPVMLSMIALFPSSQLGVELGSILLISTGQVWNMIFSVYASMTSVPREMRESAQVYRLSQWQTFTQVELPFAAIGLIWNSMMSMAGGWFFLMACEMFVLGNRDLRLPGLGSYLQTAANAGDTRAIVWGIGTMVGVIVLMDRLIWRPLIAWSEKFKFEQVEASLAPKSRVLDFLRGTRILQFAGTVVIGPAGEVLNRWFRYSKPAPARGKRNRWGAVLLFAAAGVLGYAAIRMGLMVAQVTATELRNIVWGAGATFLRVEFVLVLAGLWTIPVGVAIGLRPKLSALAQPLAQIAASVPATALFPVVLLVLIRMGGGLGIGSILLLLLGTQWYILFNVIAGASAIPTDLKEVCTVFRLSKAERWRRLFLPAIFPYLVTGFVTASGGAWNASIVAEYFRFHGQTFTTIGLGAVISEATDSGNFRVLIASTMVMAALVVTVNRLVWRRLQGLASSKYSLNT